MRKIVVWLFAFGLSTLTVVTAPAAGAAPAAPGNCYGELRAQATGAFAGWCDGPTGQIYRAYVICSDQRAYVGGWHWFGDRRGSLAVCAGGARGTNAGFQFRRLQRG